MEIIEKRYVRTVLPLFIALLLMVGLSFHVFLQENPSPLVKNGILDLSKWDGKKAFGIQGEVEFYWDRILSLYETKEKVQLPFMVEAPNNWNNYTINGNRLSGKGKATYLIHVTGAEVGVEYGVRIQRMGGSYRLYVDEILIAKNGSFGDDETVAAGNYRPQHAEFISTSNSFDLVLQVSNDIYGIGGMWDSMIFGTKQQVEDYDKLLSNSITFSAAGLIVSCIFFVAFFAAWRKEKALLILSILMILMLLRFSIIGTIVLTKAFPHIPFGYVIRLDFLTMPWAQFILLYFIHCTYGNLVQKSQLLLIFSYTVMITLIILIFPLDISTSAYMIMNYILLIVMLITVIQLMRAAWQGREGAPILLTALWLIMLFILYEMFMPNLTLEYYLLKNSGTEYLVFIIAQMIVLALRYHRAQKLEIAHLKGQIRPHFIHNALTCIISISRNEPDRARELLVDFSNYLRGFYDYEHDELVSIQQEIELVKAYIALEQARFGDKLKLEVNLEVENFLLPSLLLQPLVENAVVHGLRVKEEGGTVTVYTKQIANGRVLVGVRDDGVGYSIQSKSTRKGVSIENINHRLLRLYRTSLVYLPLEGGGCEVYFEIPYKTSKVNKL